MSISLESFEYYMNNIISIKWACPLIPALMCDIMYQCEVEAKATNQKMTKANRVWRWIDDLFYQKEMFTKSHQKQIDFILDLLGVAQKDKERLMMRYKFYLQSINHDKKETKEESN